MPDYASWLKGVSDSAMIGLLSIPGTHNSASCYEGFLPMVRCQDVCVSDQLTNGVRFFDLRFGKSVGDNPNNLIMTHGPWPTRFPFQLLEEVLQQIHDYLKRNPLEFLVVSLKQEGLGEWDYGNNELANLIWDNYINPDKEKWYTGTHMPLVAEARGKLVLIRRFTDNDEERRKDFGVEAMWDDNTIRDDRVEFVVQDRYKVPNKADIPAKIKDVEDLVEEAVDHNAKNPNGKWFLNFMSGSSFDPDCWPKAIARAMIENRVFDSFRKGSGMILGDFAEMKNWISVRTLIDTNF